MPTLNELEKWMTTKQAAYALGMSRQGVLNLAADRKVRAVKVGGEVWIYDPKDVQRLKEERSRTW